MASWKTQYDSISMMDLLENNRLVTFGSINRRLCLCEFTLPESMKGTVNFIGCDVDRMRWRWSLGSLNLQNLFYSLIELYRWYFEAIADGIATVQGCTFTKGKPCIALSYRYDCYSLVAKPNGFSH